MLYIGADHRGFALKEEIVQWLKEKGHDVVDCGAFELNKDDDYPDFSADVAKRVAQDGNSKGIVICGSGAGVTITANKIGGIRCANACNGDEVIHARAHDDLNVLALSADYLTKEQAEELIEAFLSTSFDPQERFVRRLNKIREIES